MKQLKYPPKEKPATARTVVPAATLDQTGIDFTPCPEEVARKAYFSYVNAGAPEGCHVQHWLDAEAQLIQERGQTRVHGFHNRT